MSDNMSDNMSDKMSDNMTIEARIKAREDRLEARANMRLENAKEKLNYIKNNSGPIIIDEALEKLGSNSPLLARLTRSVRRNLTAKRKKKASRELTDEQWHTTPTSTFSVRADKKENPVLAVIKNNILPMAYTIGGTQLLSYSLKGAGKMVRSGLSRLIFRRKRR